MALGPLVSINLRLNTTGLRGSLLVVRRQIYHTLNDIKGNMPSLSGVGLGGLRLHELGLDKIGPMVSKATGMLSGVMGIIGKIGASIVKLGFKFVKFGSIIAGVGAAFVHFSSSASNAWERAKWKFDIIFRDIPKEAQAAAEMIANTFKVNVATIQTHMAKIADVTKPLGMGNKMLVEMSKNIEMLAQGAVEWTEGRYDATRASTAMMKALVGEKEMLKEFGVVINDAEVFAAIKKAGHAVTPLNRAIAMYNLILERTPDLQRAAFGRITSFSSRFTQFKESIVNIAAAVGDFVKPVATEVYNLLATTNRKVAELLRGGGFAEFKTLSEQIASAISNISDRIEQINLGTLTKDMQILKSSFTEFAKSAGDALVNVFASAAKALVELLKTSIAKGIKEGASLGWEYLSGKTKHDEYLASNPKWVGESGGEHSTFNSLYTKKTVEDAKKRVAERDSQFKTLEDITSDFRKELANGGKQVKNALNILAKDLGGLGQGGKSVMGFDRSRWDYSDRKSPEEASNTSRMGFGRKLDFEGERAPILSDDDKLKLMRSDQRRLKLQQKLSDTEKEQNFGEILDPVMKRLRENLYDLKSKMSFAKEDPRLSNAQRQGIQGNLQRRAEFTKAQMEARARSPEGKRSAIESTIQKLKQTLSKLSYDPTVSEERKKEIRIGINKRIGEEESKLKGRTAALSGLTDAYNSMLVRAAGKKAPEKEIVEKVVETNTILNDIKIADEERKNILQKIADKTGSSVVQVRMAYGN